MNIELISWDRSLLFKLPSRSFESLHTMLISVCVYKAFPLSDTSLCAEMYFIGFRGEPSRLSDLRLHSQFCWWPARESGPTQPALPMTSTGVRDHTASSADDQPGSQGPHNQLCWWPAHYSGTTQPALLRTSPGVRDHTANSADDQPGVRDHTASSAEEQPGSHGPHGLLCGETAWESGTTAPLCDQPIEEWRSYSGKNWLIRQGILIRDN